MANTYGFQFRYSKERDLWELFLKVSVGASGAPTIVNGKGIASIARNSAGNYTIVLQDVYNILMGVDLAFISGSSAPAAPIFDVVSETVATPATKNVIIQTRSLAGAATDPASGEVMMIRLTMRNASN